MTGHKRDGLVKTSKNVGGDVAEKKKSYNLLAIKSIAFL
jgi:hypothetical protein